MEGILKARSNGGAAMTAVHFDSYTEARAHLKALLGAAERGNDDQLREWLVGKAR
ncbi:hypothetical protein [Nonomuraea sp. B19D2]|uniref:hypothetical protein n=1 Tax=Nonomuraea sp. B19D2 TaxID=3159561 RepID=UPI0032DB07F4